MKKTAGILTAAIVLGTMFGTAAPVFADNSTTTNSTPPAASTTTMTTNTASVPGVTAASTTNTSDTNTTGTNTATTNDTNTSTVISVYNSNTTVTSTPDPANVSPDSYLYFVTQVTQAINVALASNDLQKAELLAQYGQAQIVQANALWQSGQASTIEMNATKKSITANVMALASALQHVGNAQAQASLEKNIAKAFGRMQKHLEKEAAHASKVITTNTTTQATSTSPTSAIAIQTSGTQSTSSEEQDHSNKEHDNESVQDETMNTTITANTPVTFQRGEDGGHGKSESRGNGHHGDH